MALDAVIFDLDGTLLDTNGLHTRAWRQALAHHGFVVGSDRIALEIGKGGDRLMKALMGEAITKQHGEQLRAQHGRLYLEFVEEEHVTVFPKVEALIRALHERGLQVAVATASKKQNLENVLEQVDLDLFALADVVVTDDDVDRSKPAPDTVTAAVEKLGLSPAQCAMVGDTPYDMQASRRAGVVGLGVLTGVHPEAAMKRAGARAVYADTGDLLAHLDEALHRASPGETRWTHARLRALMDEALAEARAGMDAGQVPIGSVLARSDGTVIGRGHNEARARATRVAHAEMMAFLDAAGESDGEEGLVLATTLEPCVMCLGAALEARVDTVVYGLAAPANGGTERVTPTEEPGAFLPRLVGGVGADESRALLEEWLGRHPDHDFVRRLLRVTAG